MIEFSTFAVNHLSKNCYFISDVHLGINEPEIEKEKESSLLLLLEKVKKEADKLYILGDLFDYWFEYRRSYQKGFFRTLAALYDLTESGVEVHYLVGNHDFLHLDFFREELGVNVYFDPVEIEINKNKFFLAHGDGLVKNDRGYEILKKFFRNSLMQWMFRALHPDFGIWLGSSTSRKSRKYTDRKEYGKIDGLLETAEEKIAEGFDYVLFGHTHKRIKKQFGNSYYINLGSWLSRPCYGVFDGEEFNIIDWKKE